MYERHYQSTRTYTLTDLITTNLHLRTHLLSRRINFISNDPYVAHLRTYTHVLLINHSRAQASYTVSPSAYSPLELSSSSSSSPPHLPSSLRSSNPTHHHSSSITNIPSLATKLLWLIVVVFSVSSGQLVGAIAIVHRRRSLQLSVFPKSAFV